MKKTIIFSILGIICIGLGVYFLINDADKDYGQKVYGQVMKKFCGDAFAGPEDPDKPFEHKGKILITRVIGSDTYTDEYFLDIDKALDRDLVIKTIETDERGQFVSSLPPGVYSMFYEIDGILEHCSDSHTIDGQSAYCNAFKIAEGQDTQANLYVGGSGISRSRSPVCNMQ